MADGLGDHVDDMIDTFLGTRPDLGVVMDFIDYVGVDDSGDRFLMQAFHRVRAGMPDDFFDPSPETNGHVRSIRMQYDTLLTLDGRLSGTHDRYLDSCVGEIPWRALHTDPNWPCGECGHPLLAHDSDADDEGWVSCSHGEYRDSEGWLCQPCNCGSNMGR